MSGNEVGAKLDALIEVNKEIKQWLIILARKEVKDAIEDSLGDRPEEYRLYESLDGETPISEIIEEVPIARRTAYDRLNEWQRVGIVSKVQRGKYDKIAPLGSFGIEPPDDNS